MLVDHDPHVLPADRLAALLAGARWRRLAVLGDSIAEGVREPHAGYRDLSWTDRVAEALEAAGPGLARLELGRRGLRAAEVRAAQLGPALAFGPDLAIVAAGGNDLLVPDRFDADGVERELDAIAAALRGAGADVLLVGLLDISRSGVVPPAWVDRIRERLRVHDAIVRRVADRRGALALSVLEHPAAPDPGIYARDRLHLNARGHAIVATEAVRALAGLVRAPAPARADAAGGRAASPAAAASSPRPMAAG
jgi:lysophospholipase L1-like esterase